MGKELESVTDPGTASVVLSAAPVDVAEASVMVAEGVASEAEALDRRLEKSDASEEETALSVTMPTTLESSESREEAMLDKAPPKRPVVVGPSDEVWVASVVPAETNEEMSVSRAAWAEETMLDKTSGIPVALALALTGSGTMGVVELSTEEAPVDKVSVDSPVVVARRGKGLVEEVEEVETTVVLSASV
jgi:lysozyme family protein